MVWVEKPIALCVGVWAIQQHNVFLPIYNSLSLAHSQVPLLHQPVATPQTIGLQCPCRLFVFAPPGIMGCAFIWGHVLTDTFVQSVASPIVPRTAPMLQQSHCTEATLGQLYRQWRPLGKDEMVAVC